MVPVKIYRETVWTWGLVWLKSPDSFSYLFLCYFAVYSLILLSCNFFWKVLEESRIVLGSLIFGEKAIVMMEGCSFNRFLVIMLASLIICNSGNNVP